jgi:molybdopterin converting factor small subunit
VANQQSPTGSPTSGSVRLEYYSWLATELVGGEERGKTLAVPLTGDRTVRSLLERLARESEAFERLVYDLEGRRIREYAALIVNGRAIELAGGLDSHLQDGDQLLLLPGFSGG